MAETDFRKRSMSGAETSSARFAIARTTWSAWHMLPGYSGSFAPYCSPIKSMHVEPLKTGKSMLRLTFFNACYADGVQDFELDLRVLKRATDYLIAEIPSYAERSAIVGYIDFDWIRRFSPHLLQWKPLDRCTAGAQSSVSCYLDEIFGGA